MRSPIRIAFAALLSALAAGCVHAVVLQPAAPAQVVPGQPNVASAEAGGIRVTVNGSPWRGAPNDLSDVVTPLLVTLENHSGAPVDVRYQDFSLGTPSGMQASALPPFHIQRPGVAFASPYPYPSSGFFIGPPWAGLYPGFGAWGGPWDYDPFYYDSFFPAWQAPLPTKDMLQKALPEGVLQNGGRITGYVYFQHVQDLRRAPEVTFNATLVNAENHNQVASISIPLVAARR